MEALGCSLVVIRESLGACLGVLVGAGGSLKVLGGPWEVPGGSLAAFFLLEFGRALGLTPGMAPDGAARGPLRDSP